MFKLLDKVIIKKTGETRSIVRMFLIGKSVRYELGDYKVYRKNEIVKSDFQSCIELRVKASLGEEVLIQEFDNKVIKGTVYSIQYLYKDIYYGVELKNNVADSTFTPQEFIITKKNWINYL